MADQPVVIWGGQGGSVPHPLPQVWRWSELAGRLQAQLNYTATPVADTCAALDLCCCPRLCWLCQKASTHSIPLAQDGVHQEDKMFFLM